MKNNSSLNGIAKLKYDYDKPSKLFTITVNTYQAAQINTLLSGLKMRIEPIDNYNKEQAVKRK